MASTSASSSSSSSTSSTSSSPSTTFTQSELSAFAHQCKSLKASFNDKCFKPSARSSTVIYHIGGRVSHDGHRRGVVVQTSCTKSGAILAKRIFSGELCADKLDGLGREQWSHSVLPEYLGQYKQGIRHGYGVSRNEKGFWKNGTLAFGMTENLMERQLGDFEQNLTVIDDRKGLVFKGSFSRNGVSVGSLIVVGGETTFGKYVFAERLACQAPVEESLDAMTLAARAEKLASQAFDFVRRAEQVGSSAKDIAMLCETSFRQARPEEVLVRSSSTMASRVRDSSESDSSSVSSTSSDAASLTSLSSSRCIGYTAISKGQYGVQKKKKHLLPATLRAQFKPVDTESSSDESTDSLAHSLLSLQSISKPSASSSSSSVSSLHTEKAKQTVYPLRPASRNKPVQSSHSIVKPFPSIPYRLIPAVASLIALGQPSSTSPSSSSSLPTGSITTSIMSSDSAAQDHGSHCESSSPSSSPQSLIQDTRNMTLQVNPANIAVTTASSSTNKSSLLHKSSPLRHVQGLKPSFSLPPSSLAYPLVLNTHTNQVEFGPHPSLFTSLPTTPQKSKLAYTPCFEKSAKKLKLEPEDD